jgi:predicted NAD-dependent protein-ADP-ribosyltransferase YbiA (DUF1768 family)
MYILLNNTSLQINQFDAEEWEKIKQQIMLRILMDKFYQNMLLLESLLATHKNILVEI